MRKRIGFGILLVLTLMLVGFLMFQEVPEEEERAPDRVQVVATIYPLYDIVANVIGGTNQVTLMLPPGASPHTFSPKPQMVQDVYDADLVFMIGGVDDWMLPFAQSEEKEIARVDVGIPYLYMEEHEHEEEEHANPPAGGEYEELPDPHYWLSVENAMIIVSNVAAELTRIDPANETTYLENAARYRLLLDDLDRGMKKDLEGLADMPVLMFHGGWNYFAESYGIDIASVFEPVPGREPLPQDVEELYEIVEHEGIAALFTEPQLATDAYKPFVEDLGLSVSTLDPLGGVPGRGSYIELMEYNARTIKQALSTQ